MGCPGCEGRSCPSCPPEHPVAAVDPRHAWLDRIFLHPRWGLVGSLLVFAAVLFMVFKVSVWLDAMTTARLADAISAWQPQTMTAVIGKAVVDGLIGLAAILVPYMIPLMLLLVALEQMGIMQRIALVIDRAFHRIGLHGGVAVAFLTGFGCNVPAITGVAGLSGGRERVIASLLIPFVPCSARSAVILAVAGKYLGAVGVFGIFACAIFVIALLGRIMSRRRPELDAARTHPIPPYALPRLGELARETWLRSRDVVTVVMPLLVVGSVVLAVLQQVGADAVINAALSPVTAWWLGLPVALGLPLLFGVLRKELSLLMIFQALGTLEVGTMLDAAQITTLLLFLTFYFPCLATFAVMVRTIGRRHALHSAALSLGVALLVSGAARVLMEVGGWVASRAA